MNQQNRQYAEAQVVRDLTKKADVQIIGKKIIINTSRNQKADIGIKSRGKIDFLTGSCGYFIQGQS
jgi:hypothetical protein